MLPDHDPLVYDRAVRNFKDWQERGWLVRDPKPCYYIYAQTMDGRTQYGFVLCAHTEDYETGKIKKHELTRKDKEDDRMVHVRIQNANIEPVFFAFRDNPELDSIVFRVTSTPSEYRFTDENGFGHELWLIEDDELIARITMLFTTQVDAFYVADGHIYMELYEPLDGELEVTAEIADVDFFRQEMRELISQQSDAGILVSYNFAAETQVKPFDYVAPALLVGVVLLLIWFILMVQMKSNTLKNMYIHWLI
jgi:hypothetical protein